MPPCKREAQQYRLFLIPAKPHEIQEQELTLRHRASCVYSNLQEEGAGLGSQKSHLTVEPSHGNL